MNKDRLEGSWKQVKGTVRQRWGMLTDDDLDKIEGRREILLGKIQERYGLAREKAEKELDEFMNQLEKSPQS